MDRQIVKIGSIVVNLANVTHVELDADPDAHRLYSRNRDEDGQARSIVVLYLNTITSATPEGAPMQRTISFDGEDAEMLRKYFDYLAFGLRKRSSNHASDSDLPDRDERGVGDLTGAGEEVSELRDENERLKERVADLERAGEAVLKWFAHDFKSVTSGWPIPEDTPDAGEAERILRDALSGEDASREAEVSHE